WTMNSGVVTQKQQGGSHLNSRGGQFGQCHYPCNKTASNEARGVIDSWFQQVINEYQGQEPG
ncbi:hypothetical protein, partial [Endozoicomonas sp. ALB115]|uniref:hypothetical protein n=1 Tax=Endozoicomonas sp. ALB115 TaxID=3403074 RepID=UPI003BB6B118